MIQPALVVEQEIPGAPSRAMWRPRAIALATCRAGRAVARRETLQLHHAWSAECVERPGDRPPRQCIVGETRRRHRPGRAGLAHPFDTASRQQHGKQNRGMPTYPDSESRSLGSRHAGLLHLEPRLGGRPIVDSRAPAGQGGRRSGVRVRRALRTGLRPRVAGGGGGGGNVGRRVERRSRRSPHAIDIARPPSPRQLRPLSEQSGADSMAVPLHLRADRRRTGGRTG